MKLLSYILFAAIVLTSCSKENSDSFYAYPNNPINDTTWNQHPTAAAFVNQLPAVFAKPASFDSVNATTGGILNIADVELTVAPNSLVFPNGQLAVGKVRIEVIYLRKKGDFLRLARPTTSNNRLLETGGSFYVRALKEGQELTLVPAKGMRIKYKSPTPAQNMQLFYGEENTTQTAPGFFTWLPAQDSSFVSVFQRLDSNGSVTRGYEMYFKRLRWLNCDAFSDSSQPRTRMNITLPPNFTNVNATVYVVFKNENTVVRMNASVADRLFIINNMPIGKAVTIVSIAKIGEDLYLSKKEAIISSGLTQHLVPEKKLKAEIIQFLETL